MPKALIPPTTESPLGTAESGTPIHPRLRLGTARSHDLGPVFGDIYTLELQTLDFLSDKSLDGRELFDFVSGH